MNFTLCRVLALAFYCLWDRLLADMVPDFFFVMSRLWAMLSGQSGCQSSLLGRWLVLRLTASVLVLGLFCVAVCGLLYYNRAGILFEMTGVLFIWIDLTLLSTSRCPRCVFNMCQSCFASTWRIYGLPFWGVHFVVLSLNGGCFGQRSLYLRLSLYKFWIFWKYISLLSQYLGFVYRASFFIIIDNDFIRVNWPLD